MHAIIMVNLWSFVEGTGLAESNLGSLLPLKIQLIRYDCLLNRRNGVIDLCWCRVVLNLS